MLAQLVFDDSHAQRTDLEVRDDAVELRKTGEAEEYVHDVGRQFGAPLPVLAQNSRQRTNCRLYRTPFIQLQAYIMTATNHDSQNTFCHKL